MDGGGVPVHFLPFLLHPNPHLLFSTQCLLSIIITKYTCKRMPALTLVVILIGYFLNNNNILWLNDVSQPKSVHDEL